MDVVANLRASTAEYGVGVTGDRATHQVGQEAMRLRDGVVRSGQTAAAKAHGRHLEVPAVFLYEQIHRRLRDPEQRHRRVDPPVAVLFRQVQPLLEFNQREVVGQLAAHLVGRAKVESRRRRVYARRFEQVQRAQRADREVGVGLGRCPVVRRPRSRVDDELKRGPYVGDYSLDALLVADVDVERAKRSRQTRGSGAPSSVWWTQQAGRSALASRLEPDRVVAGSDEVGDGLGTNQASGARH
jgi:hypothetical protein